MKNSEHKTTIGLAVLAAVSLIAIEPNTANTLVAIAIVTSTVFEKRSIPRTLLVGTGMLLAPLLTAASLILLPGTHAKDDLGSETIAALRRSTAALMCPSLLIVCCLAGLSLNGRKNALIWLIGWTPTILAILISTFLFDRFMAFEFVPLYLVAALVAIEPQPTMKGKTCSRLASLGKATDLPLKLTT